MTPVTNLGAPTQSQEAQLLKPGEQHGNKEAARPPGQDLVAQVEGQLWVVLHPLSLYPAGRKTQRDCSGELEFVTTAWNRKRKIQRQQQQQQNSTTTGNTFKPHAKRSALATGEHTQRRSKDLFRAPATLVHATSIRGCQEGRHQLLQTLHRVLPLRAGALLARGWNPPPCGSPHAHGDVVLHIRMREEH